MTDFVTLPNGTRFIVGHDWCRTILPTGAEVMACGNADSPRMARRLGYGADVAALTREHDPLHNTIAAMLGMPWYYSLMQASGADVCPHLAALEEQAVLCVQEFKARWDRRR